MTLAELDEPAGIEYVGLAGLSRESLDAVLRYVQYGNAITRVRILSASGDHCLLLTVGEGDLVAVKSGFGSGYQGEGSHTFSYVLRLLEVHGASITEHCVEPGVIERLDRSALTRADLNTIDSCRPQRARQWMDYILASDYDSHENGMLWREFPPVIPFAIIDSRLVDVALTFWQAPDERLLSAYRRLEDILRNRTGINEHGIKLFSQAFQGEESRLCWKDVVGGEHAGRAQLFCAVYMAYRNRRAHRESTNAQAEMLAELLLINQLFVLEAQSIER